MKLNKSSSLRKKTYQKQWKRLTHSQRETRLRALEALNLIRQGTSLTAATHHAGINPKTFRKNVGRAVRRRKGSWEASKTDRIAREMTIFSRGKRRVIAIRDSRTASIIGRYNSAVGYLTQSGNSKNLAEFEGLRVKDARGRRYKLEIDPKNILAILEAIEDLDVPVVYAI